MIMLVAKCRHLKSRLFYTIDICVYGNSLKCTDPVSVSVYA